MIALAAILVIAAHSTAVGQLQVDSYAFSVDHHEVSDLFFLDDSVGWIAIANHDDGSYYIFATTDGGEHWAKWSTPAGVFRVWFVNRSLGWALRQVGNSERDAERVYLLRTGDGGQTWRQVSRVPVVSLADESAYAGARFAFLDASHGWFVGSSADSPVLETSDGGVTTHVVRNVRTLGVDQGVDRIYARQGQGVWMYGIGFVWHSTNLGKTWTSPINLRALKTNPYAFVASDVCFSRDGHGWLVGQDPYGMILRTKDYGLRWQRVVEDQEIGNFSSVWFWDSMNGCAAGSPTFLTCTRDGGFKWFSRDVLPAAKGEQSELFSSVVMLGSGRGWLLRAGGYLYATTDGGETWHEFDPFRARVER